MASRSHTGAALIELSIILPVLLLVIYVGLSLAVAMRAQENMNTLVREASRAALLECASENRRECRDSVATTDRCLTDIYRKFLPIGQNTLGNFELTISLYRYDTTLNQLTLLGQSRVNPQSYVGSAGRTKYAIGAGGAGTIPDSFVEIARRKDVILIGEIFHTLPLASLASFGFLPRELYFPYLL